MKIGVNSNTAIPCLAVTKSKGYEVSAKIYISADKKAKLEYDFTAKKNDNVFVGTSLEEVLGLITMWEYRAQNSRDWRASRDEGLDYERVINEAPVFDKDGNLINDEDIILT